MSFGSAKMPVRVRREQRGEGTRARSPSFAKLDVNNWRQFDSEWVRTTHSSVRSASPT